jgi:hypothetical protein
MAKTYKVRPSELFGIEDAYVAYCFDEAVAVWGLHVTSELEAIDGKNAKQIEARREKKFNELMGMKPEKQFRDPASLFK